MKARTWRVTTHVTGTRRAVEVRLYSDLNHLRGAATRYAASAGESISYSEAAGTCHGFTTEKFVRGEWRERPLVAIIRFAETHLTPLIIAHEVAHASQHIYGLDFDDEKPVAEHMHSGNEDFAYLYGELFAAVWGIFNPTTLLDLGIGKPVTNPTVPHRR